MSRNMSESMRKIGFDAVTPREGCVSRNEPGIVGGGRMRKVTPREGCVSRNNDFRIF